MGVCQENKVKRSQDLQLPSGYGCANCQLPSGDNLETTFLTLLQKFKLNAKIGQSLKNCRQLVRTLDKVKLSEYLWLLSGYR